MTRIRALRQFSHYHAGNFDQFEVRDVADEYAEALIGMDLAEEVEADTDQPPPTQTTSSSKKSGAKK